MLCVKLLKLKCCKAFVLRKTFLLLWLEELQILGGAFCNQSIEKKH